MDITQAEATLKKFRLLLCDHFQTSSLLSYLTFYFYYKFISLENNLDAKIEA